MDLTTLVSDNVNTVDVYICPNETLSQTPHWVNVGWSKPAASLPSFGKGTSQYLIEYHHRELCYVYDTANDGQRVLKRNTVRVQRQRPFVAYAYLEDQLPSHKFPCVDEVTHKQEVQRVTHRINNRLSFIIDYEVHNDGSSFYYYYLRYQHAANVDTKKMEGDLKYALSQCRRAIHG